MQKNIRIFIEAVEGTSLSQDELRKIVRHERRVELAFEDLRLADLYRCPYGTYGQYQESAVPFG